MLEGGEALSSLSRLRVEYISRALNIPASRVRDYGGYSVASKEGIYVVIDSDRLVYVFKPTEVRSHKPKLLSRVFKLKLPVSKIKPLMMSGGVIAPAIVGGMVIDNHNVKGWVIRYFSGSFYLKDDRREWIEGKCKGLVGLPAVWDAVPVSEAIRIMSILKGM